MTQEGYDELEAELDELVNVKMKEIAKSSERPESREISLRMPSMMLLRTSSPRSMAG